MVTVDLRLLPTDDGQHIIQLPLHSQSHDQLLPEPRGLGAARNPQKTRHPSFADLRPSQVHHALRLPHGQPAQHPDPGDDSDRKTISSDVVAPFNMSSVCMYARACV